MSRHRSNKLDSKIKRTRKGKKVDSVDKAVGAIFDSANVGRKFPIPNMKRGFETVIVDIFDQGFDVVAEYQKIEDSLSIKNALTPGKIQKAANDTEEMARRAFRLYVIAKFEYEAYIREIDVLIGALRESATAKLENEKAQKIRTKQITEADVREYAAQMHPDEWNDIHNRQNKAKGMLAYIETLADLAKSRCYTVSNMLNPRGKL